MAAVASTAASAAGSGTLLVGPASKASTPTYQGLYDSHKDTYLITDVSNKAQATAWHVNYAPALAARSRACRSSTSCRERTRPAS